MGTPSWTNGHVIAFLISWKNLVRTQQSGLRESSAHRLVGSLATEARLIVVLQERRDDITAVAAVAVGILGLLDSLDNGGQVALFHEAADEREPSWVVQDRGKEFWLCCQRCDASMSRKHSLVYGPTYSVSFARTSPTHQTPALSLKPVQKSCRICLTVSIRTPSTP